MYREQIPLIEDYLRNLLTRLIKFGGYSACALFDSEEPLCFIRIAKNSSEKCSLEIKSDDLEYDYCKSWVDQKLDDNDVSIESGMAVFDSELYVLVMEKSAVNWDDIDASVIIDFIRGIKFFDGSNVRYIN